jgi:GTP 3',8-cyclase
MLDRFNREINYLRISVTDRCNLRCKYCMPVEGIPLISHDDVLSFEEIYEFAKVAAEMGMKKIRLTGGEPLVRRGILDLVQMLSSINGIEDFAMTTNGVLLEKFAQPLKDNGLHRVNISLDTMDPVKYKEITRVGSLDNVLNGIKKAMEVGFRKIKINTVVLKDRNEKNAQSVLKFANENGLEIRFIRKMDLAKGEFWVVDGGTGGDCPTCSRLRLSSDGKIYPCLFSNVGISIKGRDYKEVIQESVKRKPEFGKINKDNGFNYIGG